MSDIDDVVGDVCQTVKDTLLRTVVDDDDFPFLISEREFEDTVDTFCNL